jgi:N-acetylneuraminic acid mutarotase
MAIRADLRQSLPSRPARPRRLWTPLAAATLALVGAASAASLDDRWSAGTSVPEPRTEVAAARFGSEIGVVGGFLADGTSSSRADAYSPARNAWRPLPRYPLAVNHAAATAWRGRLIVIGGYVGPGTGTARGFELVGGRWRGLPPMPEWRGAAGAAVVGNRLYVVGGVSPSGLARRTFVLDLRTRRWSRIVGPEPREHLAVTALGGRVYALGGRLAGIDTNLRTLQVLDPRTRRWSRLAPIPHARGGTGAAAVGTELVSVGGEEPSGTIASVYAYSTRTRRWRRLPDLPTPRHGLGVASSGRRIYVVAGGPRPGLFVSDANEVLTLDPR